MVARKDHLSTDALREIRGTFNRYVSILVLAALAVAFLAGLRTTAPDMQYTADNYYDRTRLMDGYVLSTLGLTQGDLDALAASAGVEAVEGSRDLDAVAVDRIVSVRSMPQELDLLEVREGRLPQSADECVTENLLLVKLGLQVGDRLELTLEEDGQGDLVNTAYTIVGVVDSPLYVSLDRGASSLGSGSVDAFVYVPGENFTFEHYTCAYFTGEGLAALDTYGEEYEDRLDALVDSLDPLAEERARLRYDELIGDAQNELDDARKELEDAKAEAERELADAWRELQDARRELDGGWEEYRDGEDAYARETAGAQRALNDALAGLRRGERDLADGRARYQDGLAEYNDGLGSYEEGVAQYEEAAAPLEEQKARLEESWAQYHAALAPYEGTPQYDMAVSQMAAQKAQLDGAQAQIDAGYEQLAPVKAELDRAKAELDEAKRELDQALADIDQAEIDLRNGWSDYNRGVRELNDARIQGRQELDDALAELNDGEREYADGLKEYEDGRKEADGEIVGAQKKLDDAQDELDDVEECEWYVLGRFTNAGIVGYSQDSGRVSNLANVFPVIFFLVAALACLTTMTRMVEEQRTQIGALKALGFSRLAISKKYIGYAFSASLVGGILGLALGCTLIPLVIANAFNIMYAIPALEFKPQIGLYFGAVLAAVACTTGAALWACLSTLMAAPADLMRPRAPKAGKRVFLEHIRPLWRRLTFTWKVTMRNLFRYQRRFWMTVIGIGGCTALIVAGFGLHESIFSILNEQFDHVFRYDALLGLDAGQEELAAVERYLADSPWVEDYLQGSDILVEASTRGPAQSAYLRTVADQERFAQFIRLSHRLDGTPAVLTADGVVVTEKLAELLEVSPGDTITLEEDGKRVEARVADIAENYAYHYIYVSEEYYRVLFGKDAQRNVMLLRYSEEAGEAESDAVSADLMAMDGVDSYSYIATLRDNFTDSMEAIDYAVVIIITAAAALAFVVLYNLTNINITERVRELATLKVLGFFDREVTAYVYRENLFLTLFGIVLGLVMGRFLHAWMVLTVEVEMVMFGRTAPPYAYWLAAVLTVVFSIAVNVAAHYKLKKVDMVESLKTVE
ncbi:MAG: FtsX-like permease family protein [Oscillospiraceae bacterium]|nr:FtsX-like permease family protein [Oscillospiraceae bacterium]